MSAEEKNEYANQVINWAKMMSDVFEDIGSGIIGFIPNGLEIIYDDVFKMLPLIGEIFCVRSVEILLKLLTGITLGQMLAREVGRFLFRPVGFMLGALLGTSMKREPNYQRSIRDVSYALSGQTLIGSFIGLFVFVCLFRFTNVLSGYQLNWQMVAISLGLGAMVGLIAKSMLLLSFNMVSKANAANMRRNVKRAKALNVKLKEVAKQKAKTKIYREAQDLLLQLNGAESQQHLEAFFNEKYGKIAFHTYKKIDRHFDYLTDRACCGDLKALQKLNQLIPRRKKRTSQPQSSATSQLDTMIDRIFNERTLFQLRDSVDNAYDNWRYKYLQEA